MKKFALAFALGIGSLVTGCSSATPPAATPNEANVASEAAPDKDAPPGVRRPQTLRVVKYSCPDEEKGGRKETFYPAGVPMNVGCVQVSQAYCTVTLSDPTAPRLVEYPEALCLYAPGEFD